MLKFLAIYLLSCPSIFAAGSGGHGSPKDLIFPAINLILLVSFFVWKLGPKTKEYFKKKHVEIKESADRAKTMKFEAQMQLEKQEKKNQNLVKTIEEIKASANKEVESYKSEKEKENQQRVEKLSKDADSKVAMQREELVRSLNKELIDLVINKAKSKVGSEGDLKKSIASNLMKGL